MKSFVIYKAFFMFKKFEAGFETFLRLFEAERLWKVNRHGCRFSKKGGLPTWGRMPKVGRRILRGSM